MNTKKILISAIIFSTMFGNVFAEDVLEKSLKKESNMDRICTMEYDPVCAIDENGMEKTFGNRCVAGENKIIENSTCEDKKPILNIKNGQYIESPLVLTGNSSNSWFAEHGKFSLVGSDGDALAKGNLKKESEEGLIETTNFYSELTFEPKKLKTGKLVFQKNGTIGEKKKDDGFEIEINFKKNTTCTREYAPVCGKVDLEERCIKEPCPEFVEKVFSNKCTAEVSNAEILSEGLCASFEEKKETKEKKLKAVKNNKKVLDKKSEETFSKFEIFIETLNGIVVKIENKLEGSDKNTAESILKLEEIKKNLLEAENNKNEAKVLFVEIIQKENRLEVSKSLKDSGILLAESKKGLKSVFEEIKSFIESINKK
jgi:hypothetical protein